MLGLVDRAFGPGRFAKVSERLREGNELRADLSFCAFVGDSLVGSVRQWPVAVGDACGLFLGPVAVEREGRGRGVGFALLERCVRAADLAGEPFILLVGDLPLFEPHGFVRAPERGVRLPGPVDPRRVLLRTSPAAAPLELCGPARPPRGAA